MQYDTKIVQIVATNDEDTSGRIDNTDKVFGGIFVPEGVSEITWFSAVNPSEQAFTTGVTSDSLTPGQWLPIPEAIRGVPWLVPVVDVASVELHGLFGVGVAPLVVGSWYMTDGDVNSIQGSFHPNVDNVFPAFPAAGSFVEITAFDNFGQTAVDLLFVNGVPSGSRVVLSGPGLQSMEFTVDEIVLTSGTIYRMNGIDNAVGSYSPAEFDNVCIRVYAP